MRVRCVDARVHRNNVPHLRACISAIAGIHNAPCSAMVDEEWAVRAVSICGYSGAMCWPNGAREGRFIRVRRPSWPRSTRAGVAAASWVKPAGVRFHTGSKRQAVITAAAAAGLKIN